VICNTICSGDDLKQDAPWSTARNV